MRRCHQYPCTILNWNSPLQLTPSLPLSLHLGLAVIKFIVNIVVVYHNHRNCHNYHRHQHHRSQPCTPSCPRPEYRTGLTIATKLTSRLVSTRVIRRHAALSVPTSKNVDNLNLPYAVQQINDRCATPSRNIGSCRRGNRLSTGRV